MEQQSIELLKVVVAAIAATGGLWVFIKGVMEFSDQNKIRRYEKFHEMSKRFDENEIIQKVCDALHGAAAKLEKQEKEVFICFMEEIYFMTKSGIMKDYMARYTFGYYAQMAMEHPSFLSDKDKLNPFYTHFIAFCESMKTYRPVTDPKSQEVCF